MNLRHAIPDRDHRSLVDDRQLLVETFDLAPDHRRYVLSSYRHLSPLADSLHCN